MDLGSGDALLGVKYNLWQNDNQSSGVAIKTDIYLPVSTAGSWLGEDQLGQHVNIGFILHKRCGTFR